MMNFAKKAFDSDNIYIDILTHEIVIGNENGAASNALLDTLEQLSKEAESTAPLSGYVQQLKKSSAVSPHLDRLKSLLKEESSTPFFNMVRQSKFVTKEIEEEKPKVSSTHTSVRIDEVTDYTPKEYTVQYERKVQRWLSGYHQMLGEVIEEASALCAAATLSPTESNLKDLHNTLISLYTCLEADGKEVEKIVQKRPGNERAKQALAWLQQTAEAARAVADDTDPLLQKARQASRIALG